jgi:enoyl-[acyl-carrier protein] reductase I
MKRGGTLFTMTYYGSQMVVKNYNIMGVAKAALESAVRYMAAELGPRAFACMPSHPGPWPRVPHQAFRNSMRCSTKRRKKHPPAAWSASMTWGVATAFLAHDAARLITGETLYVDGGYHIID